MKATWQGPRLRHSDFEAPPRAESVAGRFGTDRGAAPLPSGASQAYLDAVSQVASETRAAVHRIAEGAEPKWGTHVIAQINQGNPQFGMSGDFVMAQPRRSEQLSETMSGLANQAVAAATKAVDDAYARAGVRRRGTGGRGRRTGSRRG